MFGWTGKSFKMDSATPVVPGAGHDLLVGKAGMIAGTKVATQLGWRPVEAIAAGDEVLTFDNGLQTVVAVEREIIRFDPFATPEEDWPLAVPAGALGNRDALTLLPGQAVMIESDVAETLYGDPFAVVPVEALDGFSGITRRLPDHRIEIVTLRFAEDQLVFVNSGLLIHCPRTDDMIARSLSAAGADTPVLSLQDAVYLIALLEIESDAVLAAAPSTGGGLDTAPRQFAA